MTKRLSGKQRRVYRTRNIERNSVRETRYRMSVHRSNKQIYAQIIDDVKGVTLASASSLDKDLKLKKGSDVEAAQKVGKLIADRAKKAGINKVQFDRGSFIYHGRVKAVAEGAREGGLEF